MGEKLASLRDPRGAERVPKVRPDVSLLRRAGQYQARLERREREAAQTRADKARHEAGRLVHSFLDIDPELRRLVLFGSLATGRITSSDFDIDLAVLCSPEKFFALVSTALDSEFEVDLVDLATVDARIRRSIDRDGVVLYEK